METVSFLKENPHFCILTAKLLALISLTLIHEHNKDYYR